MTRDNDYNRQSRRGISSGAQRQPCSVSAGGNRLAKSPKGPLSGAKLQPIASTIFPAVHALGCDGSSTGARRAFAAARKGLPTTLAGLLLALLMGPGSDPAAALAQGVAEPPPRTEIFYGNKRIDGPPLVDSTSAAASSAANERLTNDISAALAEARHRAALEHAERMLHARAPAPEYNPVFGWRTAAAPRGAPGWYGGARLREPTGEGLYQPFYRVADDPPGEAWQLAEEQNPYSIFPDSESAPQGEYPAGGAYYHLPASAAPAPVYQINQYPAPRGHSVGQQITGRPGPSHPHPGQGVGHGDAAGNDVELAARRAEANASRHSRGAAAGTAESRTAASESAGLASAHTDPISSAIIYAPVMSFIVGFLFCLGLLIVFGMLVARLSTKGGAIFRVELVNGFGASARESAHDHQAVATVGRVDADDRVSAPRSSEAPISPRPARPPGTAVYADDLELPLPMGNDLLTFEEQKRMEEEQIRQREQAMLENLFEQNVKLRQTLAIQYPVAA